jgi:hypothetical protein
MKKVVDKYFNVHNMYLKVELGIWSLISNVIAWAARLLNQADTFIEFHLIKNGNQDSMKKMPIQDLKAWAHGRRHIRGPMEEAIGKPCLLNK